MAEYTFKRGPVRSAETWTVDGQSLQGKDKTVRWEDVTEIQFADTRSKNLIIGQLILKTDKTKLHLQCNDRHAGQSRRAFLGMCREVAERLEGTRPEVRCTQTMGTKMLGWMLALMGLAAMGFGLYFGVVNGVLEWGEQGSGFGFGLGIAALLVGLLFVWLGSPWKKVPPKTMAETREWIDSIMQTG